MNKKFSFVTLLAASNAVMISQASAQVEIVHFDSVEVNIQSLQSSGSGCPFGTVSSTIAPDGKSFVLGFDEYIAEAGPDISRRENRKTCQVTAVLGIPNGFSFTLADVNYRGYADLDAQVSAKQTSSYFFAGARQEATLRTEFVGPISDNYQLSDRIGLESLVWSSCNATEPVVIKTEIKVDNRRARDKSGLITLDTIDGKLTHRYGLMFKKCDETSNAPSAERI
ncbi:DUF4360 domain-containing protein [Vibrio ostreicida]|uniref:DUF4360 domain-containing protein n=1 Tax=Vibrio ostreicida TaxID=526588 RepID=A0ABT8BVT6_9VIBR|nr:DUF4360 domain-containing protein [Vibrio ostreicida]MDN3610768.1 DUF4360 domain-containing protein [Vibrio ostreicida]NPD07237.1 DUF4360 domain-containing protein [Vibrio ostreicida]